MMQKLQFTLMIMAARRNPIMNAAMGGLGEAAGIIESGETKPSAGDLQSVGSFS